jgi:DNA-binding MarR family transcriptional regulator
MATTTACAALVDVFPTVLRLKRSLAATAQVAGTAPLRAMWFLRHPRVSELAEHLHLDVSTVSRQVTHLRTQGLITTNPDPADGRSQQLSLTPDGIAELVRSRESLVAQFTERLASWDDADVETLAALLDRLGRTADTPLPQEIHA